MARERRRDLHLFASDAHLSSWLARERLKKMRLLVSFAHLPISRDHGRHRPAHLSGADGPENVTDVRLPGSGARPSASLDRFSTRDAHLPRSKMHGNAGQSVN
jgi:hypothetical protein